jgi:hypothetical protein
MQAYPAVVVHGLADVRQVLACAAPVTLLSAPGAGVFAGCLWWREIIAVGRLAFPDTPQTDILDCADASGLALGALRCGVSRLVLWPEASGWPAVAAIAQAKGGFVLTAPPPALDLAQPRQRRRLHAWLRASPP